MGKPVQHQAPSLWCALCHPDHGSDPGHVDELEPADVDAEVTRRPRTVDVALAAAVQLLDQAPGYGFGVPVVDGSSDGERTVRRGPRHQDGAIRVKLVPFLPLDGSPSFLGSLFPRSHLSRGWSGHRQWPAHLAISSPHPTLELLKPELDFAFRAVRRVTFVSTVTWARGSTLHKFARPADLNCTTSAEIVQCSLHLRQNLCNS